MGSAWPQLFVKELDLEKAIEEGAISPERDAEIFCGYISAAIPVSFQVCPRVREGLRQAANSIGDQCIRLFVGSPRLINEARLDVCPAGAQFLDDLVRQ